MKKNILPLILLFIMTFGCTQKKESVYKTLIKTSHNGKYTYQTVENDPLNARIYTLDNGLTVMLAINKATPSVQTLVSVKAGSKNDPAHNTGLAHYLEHMLFKGTDKIGSINFEKEKFYLDQIDSLYEVYNKTTDEVKRNNIYSQIDSVSNIAAKYAIPNEYDRLISFIGGTRVNAFTSTEQTVYMSDVPANQIENWLKIESERFRKPVLRLFHTELETVYEEKNRALDNDNRKVFHKTLELLFKNHAIGTQTTLGSSEHLRNPSLIEIRNYYEHYYVPNNMAVIIVGDIDPDEVIKQVDEHFSFMKAADVDVYEFEPEEPMDTPVKASVVGPDAENVLLAYRMPGAHHEESILLDVVSNLLWNRRAGLIDINLNQKQKVLESSAGNWTMNDYSLLFLGGRPKDGQTLEDVENLLLEQIEHIKQGDFDEALLEAIINNLKVTRIRQQQENSGIAFALSNNFVINKDWIDYVLYPDKMSQITKDDIIEFANKNFQNNYAVVYKNSGTDTTIEKVEQPQITPIEINRDAESEFFSNIRKAEVPSLQPVFLEYDKIVNTFSLKKGLDVYHVKNDENELFNLYYVFDMGKNHNKELTFAINYLEFLGTDKYTPAELSMEFYRLACNLNVNTSNDQVYVSITGLNSNFEEAIQLFEHLLENAKPDEEALNNLVNRTIRTRNDDKLNKGTILWSALRNYASFGAENPFTNVLTNDELHELNAGQLVEYIKDLNSYQHKVYYYGPLNTDELEYALKEFHKTPETLKAYPEPKDFTRNQMDEALVFFVDYDMVQTEVIWTRKVADFNPEIVPVSNLFNQYFGGGMSSIVFQHIREAQALAYSTFSRFIIPVKKEDPFYIFAYVGTQYDKTHQAIASMNELLYELPHNQSAFNDAITSIRQGIETDRIIRHRILFDYETARKRGLDFDIRKKIYNETANLTFEDIQNFHANKYKGQAYFYCIIGSKENIKPESFEKYGKVKVLTLEEIFGY